MVAPIFPTWHRPYVALYEQTLASHFPSIIAQYHGSVRHHLHHASLTWRLPFWEWAVTDPALPVEFTTPTITIYGTHGHLIGHSPNPFLAYKFNPIDPSFFGSFAIWPTTLRCPSTGDATAKSQPDVVKAGLGRSQLKQNVWSIFED